MKLLTYKVVVAEYVQYAILNTIVNTTYHLIKQMLQVVCFILILIA